MGLCLLLPILCGNEKESKEESDFSSYEEENIPVRTQKISERKTKKSKDTNTMNMTERKSNKTKFCLICHKAVHSSSLTMSKNVSVNTPKLDDRDGGIFCSCDTSYYR